MNAFLTVSALLFGIGTVTRKHVPRSFMVKTYLLFSEVTSIGPTESVLSAEEKNQFLACCGGLP